MCLGLTTSIALRHRTSISPSTHSVLRSRHLVRSTLVRQSPRYHHYHSQFRLHQCLVASEGMHVPSDSFGGVSPEAKAAEVLRTFFTFAAVKIVLSQLEGIGRGDLGAYNAEGYGTLSKFLRENPLRNDAEGWLTRLMQEDEMIALRICEVRAAYAGKDFEWENLKRLTVDGLSKSNVEVQRTHMASKYGKMFGR